jgi:hypothetical protein
MRYGQFCPIAKAAEIVAERWTPLTYFWIDLEKRITAVALMQILPIGDPHVQETMIGFERARYTAIASIA